MDRRFEVERWNDIELHVALVCEDHSNADLEDLINVEPEED